MKKHLCSEVRAASTNRMHCPVRDFFDAPR